MHDLEWESAKLGFGQCATRTFIVALQLGIRHPKIKRKVRSDKKVPSIVDTQDSSQYIKDRITSNAYHYTGSYDEKNRIGKLVYRHQAESFDMFCR